MKKKNHEERESVGNKGSPSGLGISLLSNFERPENGSGAGRPC